MADTVLSQRKSGRGVKFTIQLHLAPRFKMSGAIPLPPPHIAFVEWTGKLYVYD
jgi:hypothetical protein